jgi:MoaD family protein
MAVHVRAPGALRAAMGGVTEVDAEGQDVAQVLCYLRERYPDLARALYNEHDELRPVVQIYVNDEHVRFRQGLRTPLHDGDRVYIVPLVMGG